MKILHIITRLDRGGSTEDVLYNCLSLMEKGHHAVLLYGKTVSPSIELFDKAQMKGVEFIALPQLRRNLNPAADLCALVRIQRMLSAIKPDVIHTHTSKAGILGRWAGWIHNAMNNRRTPIVHSTHGHVFYGYYGKLLSHLFVLLERWTSMITDRIIVLTRNELAEHLAAGVGREDQFSVVHSGIVFDERAQRSGIREQLGIPAEAVVIGSAGRFDPVKGYPTLIEAARLLNLRISGKDVRFLLIGDGSQRAQIEEKIRQYALSGKVILSGWVQNPDDYIAATDIYIQPSLNEGMGKTLVTAQGMGKPVVASRVQGIVSLINDGTTGLLVSPGNAAELAAALEQLIDDAALRQRLGENARSGVEEIAHDSGFRRFSIEHMNYLLDRLYAGLRRPA